MLDELGQGEIRLALLEPVPVVYAVDAQQGIVAYVSQLGEPFHVGSDGIEHVPVRHEISLVTALEFVVPHYADSPELQRRKILQKVIMVAPDVYHLGDAILHHPHYRLEKEGVFRLPAALPGSLLQLPAVNDIPVENQPVAVNSAQELRRLLNFSVSGAKMHVRDDDCPVMWSFFHVHFMFSAPTGDFPMEQYRKPAETSSEGS